MKALLPSSKTMQNWMILLSRIARSLNDWCWNTNPALMQGFAGESFKILLFLSAGDCKRWPSCIFFHSLMYPFIHVTLHVYTWTYLCFCSVCTYIKRSSPYKRDVVVGKGISKSLRMRICRWHNSHSCYKCCGCCCSVCFILRVVAEIAIVCNYTKLSLQIYCFIYHLPRVVRVERFNSCIGVGKFCNLLFFNCATEARRLGWLAELHF